MPISRLYSIFLVLVLYSFFITFTNSEAFVSRRKTSYKYFWEPVQLNYTKKTSKQTAKKEEQKTPNSFRSGKALSSASYFFILLFRYAVSIFS